MAHEELIRWGKSALEKEQSLATIEEFLLRKGLDKDAAFKALNDITSFEHKIHQESETVSKVIVSFMAIMMFVLSVLIFLNLANVI